MKSGHLALTAALLAPSLCFVSPARAEQFILFDSQFTFTKAEADAAESPSHHYIRALNPARPADWTQPVDYRNGTVHIRTEVLDKPAGDEITQWVLCYIAVAGTGDAYGCTGSGTYTSEGVYERDESMNDWWQNELIDWSQGIAEMHLVLKDQDDSNGFASLRPDFEKFFSTTVRITMVQVAAGSSYDPSSIPDTPGGESDAGTSPPPEVDSGTPSAGDGQTGEPDDPNSPASGDMSGSSSNGNAGSMTGDDESTQDAQTADSSGCSVGTMGTAASPHVGVMALGLSALIVRAKRRKRTPQG